MAAILFVQILAASGAETFAIGFADRVDGDFGEGVVADDWRKIDLRVFGELEFFAVHFGMEGEQFDHVPVDGVLEGVETAHTFDLESGFEIGGQKQTLRCAADAHVADKAIQSQVFGDFYFFFVERDVVSIARFTADEEADVNTEGFAEVWHSDVVLSDKKRSYGFACQKKNYEKNNDQQKETYKIY